MHVKSGHYQPISKTPFIADSSPKSDADWDHFSINLKYFTIKESQQVIIWHIYFHFKGCLVIFIYIQILTEHSIGEL